MARIIYAVAGEGFGHSSRSHLIGQRLLDSGHDVMFAGSQKSLVYLRENFGTDRVHEVYGLRFAFTGDRIDKSATVRTNIVKYPGGIKKNHRLYKNHYKPFEPHLVISDFEPFSAWWAWRKRIPYISIDHEHVLSHCILDKVENNWFPRLTAWAITRFYYFGAFTYLMVNFFKAPTKSDSAVVVPPIVRPAVKNLTTTTNNHLILYFTNMPQRDYLVETLKNFPNYNFFIYGYDEHFERGNCISKKRSTEGFLNDLASCKGIVASAGFSLISECMYLRKPMLLIPVTGQYEQIINAHYIDKLGIGIQGKKVDEETIGRFIETIEHPKPKDDKILWPDNEGFFRQFQKVLHKLPTPIDIKTEPSPAQADVTGLDTELNNLAS